MNLWSKLGVFLGAVLLGTGLAMTFHIVLRSDSLLLVQADYADAEAYKEWLLQELSEEQRIQKDLQAKLTAIEESSKTSTGTRIAMEEELQRNRSLLGYAPLEGPGIRIELQDGLPKEGETEGSIDSWLRIIHNEDMLKLINELKLSGAEALAINGERITATSEIYCSWAFISINGKNLPAPFVLQVVGDPAGLAAYGEMEFSQLRIMRNRGISVNVTEQHRLKLEGSVPPIHPEYLQEN